jgi:hypothetical protein
LRTVHSNLTGSARVALSEVLDDESPSTRSTEHVPRVEVVSVNALATAQSAASWAPPLPLDKDAVLDRRVRLGSAVTLWLGLFHQ